MNQVRTPTNAAPEPTASEHEVFFGILKAAELLARSLSDTLRPFHLTLSQYSVLRALRHGQSSEGLGCREVGARLASRGPDITRLLDRLEARGLISRRRARPDRRVVRAQITEEGLAMLKVLDEAIGRLQARHLGHLGARDLSVLGTLLQATVDAAS